MSALLIAIAGFVAMEAVSYALHRWVMHGVGYSWHRSHHEPRRGRWEANDRFPLVFAAIGIALFVIGSGLWPPAWWIAVGVSAYGLAYLAVHEIVIHRRVPVRLPTNRYLRWLTDAHRDHHRGGDEPYGMLLPLVRRPRYPASGDDPLLRDGASADNRPGTRPERRANAARRARL